jgi:hypothetical protein
MARPAADVEIAARIELERGAAGVLRKAWACAWWLVRAHVADVHLLPRNEALEPPPARWLHGWPAIDGVGRRATDPGRRRSARRE